MHSVRNRSIDTKVLRIIELDIAGVFELRLSPITDERGHFMRTYDVEAMREAGLHREWIQENQSHNRTRSIVRGLHFQFPPSAETKLVRCIRGEIFDVFVDLRKGSASFGRWGAVVLSESARNMVYIPRGFAHGYCTLSEVSDVLYKVDHAYDKPREGGICWSDPELGIPWPVENIPRLSARDQAAMSWREFVGIHGALEVGGDR